MRFGLILLLTATAFSQWQPQQSHTTENLRGINGTYLVTKDGGATWNQSKVPGADTLDFRGVKAFRSEVFLLAAGPGDKSRIYHLHVGKPWELQFTNSDP